MYISNDDLQKQINEIAAQTTEAGKLLRVMEIPEKPCRGLFLAACYAKRNRVSLGRLLSEQFSGEHYAASI